MIKIEMKFQITRVQTHEKCFVFLCVPLGAPNLYFYNNMKRQNYQFNIKKFLQNLYLL